MKLFAVDYRTNRQKVFSFRSLDAAIGSKNYARQQYLSNGFGTADQPLHHEQQWI